MENVHLRRPTISIEYNPPLAIYHNGDLVQGYVVINTLEPLTVKSIFVRFLGLANVYSDPGASQQFGVRICNFESYFDVLKTLFDAETDVSIAAGHHHYPFNFQMPTNIPSSFEGHGGNVRYACKAVVNLPSYDQARSYQHESPFVVKAEVDIGNIPNVLSPLCFEGSKLLFGFCCYPIGCLKARIVWNHKAFVLGNDITLAVSIVNETSKPIQIFETSLRKAITYFDRGEGSYCESEIISMAPSGCTCNLDRESSRAITLNIPHTTPPTNLGKGCNIIKVAYYVQVVISISVIEQPSTSIRLRIPVFIGTEMSSAAVGNAASDIQSLDTPPSYANTVSSGSFLDLTTSMKSIPGTPPPSYDSLEFAVQTSC